MRGGKGHRARESRDQGDGGDRAARLDAEHGVRWAKQGSYSAPAMSTPSPHPYEIEVPDLHRLRKHDQQQGAEQGAHAKEKRAVSAVDEPACEWRCYRR